MVEARLASMKEVKGMIEEANTLGIVDTLVDEVMQAYAANPDVKKLPT